MKKSPFRLVYIAGPYTKPDPVVNTRNAIIAGRSVIEAGHAVVIPHLFLLAEMVAPKPYEFWLEHDRKLLFHCTDIIRLPGESSGADSEMKIARELKLDIWNSLEDFLGYWG